MSMWSLISYGKLNCTLHTWAGACLIEIVSSFVICLALSHSGWRFSYNWHRISNFIQHYKLVAGYESTRNADLVSVPICTSTHISHHVFQLISHRDLSKTAITYLPTYGLKHLEVLRLQQTPSLTVIPSIYHFEVSCVLLCIWSS